MNRIAIILEEGRFGGPQRWIASVSGRLKKSGFDLIVVFPAFDSKQFHEELNLEEVETRRISLHRLTKEKTHLIKFVISFIPETLSLYKLLKQEKVDVVHCNNSWQFKGVIAGRLARKKIIWHLHETATPFFINSIFKLSAKKIADAFIAAGERVRAYYLSDKRLSEKQIMEIQAPVDTAVFDPESVKEDQKIADYPGLKIITVGNINPLKGIEYFIEMSSVLNKQYNNLSFFVIGSHFVSQKAYSDKMVRMTQKYDLDNLHFCGSSENISSVLKAADIYVCSSIAEASPISVWEAMSMGKAIVSTDVGDVAKFIKDGESGFVVPIKDAVTLAERVELLIKNANLRKKVGANARNIAIKNLDVDICVKKHAEFYKKIIAKR